MTRAGDLYGRTIGLDILARLRATRRFAGLEDLLGQIRLDVQQAREICARPSSDRSMPE